MPASVEHLAPVMPFQDLGSHNVDHPMRVVTRDAATSNAWDTDTAAKVGSLFDSMAAEWHESHSAPERTASLVDALDRGSLPAGRLVELGCGTGAGTAVLAGRRPVHAAIDLSAGMPAEVDRVLTRCGALVWVNTGGEATPIHLTAEELLEALPGSWDAVASRAGTGTWAVAHRSRHSA